MSSPQPAWSDESLVASSALLSQWLIEHPDIKIVLAESCTAGLIAAALASTPGISQSLCGSFVTYRESAKIGWLDIDPKQIAQFSSVSSEVSDAMALAALAKTPEANWSLAITGHLGPNAPSNRDGAIFISVASRIARCVVHRNAICLPHATRTMRQVQAASAAVESLYVELASGFQRLNS